MSRSSKGVKPRQTIRLADGTTVTVEGPADDGEHVMVRFPGEILPILERNGEIPLPPYLGRAAVPEDRERYQTVYARDPGSSAAPTAGLHLDEKLLTAMRERGVETVEVTLHVGPGTFQPIRVDNLDEHVMHAEPYTVPDDVMRRIRAAKSRGNRVIAVGTTSVRAIESAALYGLHGLTRLFIRPGFDFKIVDGMLTNFHLPESTLLMLVAAVVGKQRIFEAYALAQKERYRFFSYGDAMLLERPQQTPI